MKTSTLANGLRVVSEQTGGGPCAVALWVDAGSIDEGPEEHGLAHFLEHMLFKGTTRRGIGESARTIEALGGDLNAWTSIEQTMLYATVPTNWRTALDVVLDMASHPLFDDDEVARERDVVLDEIRGDDDNPDEALSKALHGAMWGEHPYGRRVLGDADQVAGFTAADLRRFLTTHWTAHRSVVSVVCEDPHEDVVAFIEAATADWSRGEPRREIPAAAPTVPTTVRVQGYASTGLEFAWRVPPVGHPDLAALEVLSTLLADGGGGLLSEALNFADDPGFSPWADLDPRRITSEFRLAVVPHEGKASAVTRVVRDTLIGLTERVDGPAVQRARAILAADVLTADEDVEERASDQAWYLAMYGDVRAKSAHRRAIAAVQPEDVRAVAQRWIQPDQAVSGVMGPGVRLPTLQRLLRTRPKRRRGRVDERGRHGTRIIILPNDSPLVAAQVLAEGGSRRIPDHLAGLPSAWSDVIKNGAGPLDSHAFPRALDALGSTVRATATRHALGLRALAPAENTTALLELMGHAIVDPHFDEEHWETQREEMLDDIRTLGDRPGTVASMKARHRLWAGHPWRLPSMGTTSSLMRIRGQTLRRWHQEHFTGPDTLIVISGNVDPTSVLDALMWTEDLPATSSPFTAPAAPRLRPGRVRATAGQHQAHVALYGRGTDLTELDRRGLELATSLLDGQAGRLFMELRERRALAYDVWATQFEGIDGGSFGIGLSTRPDGADEAAHALRTMLEDLATTEPTHEELDRARATLLGGVVLARQRIAHRVAALAGNTLLGLPTDPATWRQAVAAVTPAEVSREVRAVLDRGLLEVAVVPEA